MSSSFTQHRRPYFANHGYGEVNEETHTVFLRHQYFGAHPAGANDPLSLLMLRERADLQYQQHEQRRRQRSQLYGRGGAAGTSSAIAVSAGDDAEEEEEEEEEEEGQPNDTALCPPPPFVLYQDGPAVVVSVKDISPHGAERVHSLAFGDERAQRRIGRRRQQQQQRQYPHQHEERGAGRDDGHSVSLVSSVQSAGAGAGGIELLATGGGDAQLSTQRRRTTSASNSRQGSTDPPAPAPHTPASRATAATNSNSPSRDRGGAGVGLLGTMWSLVRWGFGGPSGRGGGGIGVGGGSGSPFSRATSKRGGDEEFTASQGPSPPSSAADSTGNSAGGSAKSGLALMPLVGLMFCTAIGGSYGLEESLHAGGASATLLGVIFLPFIFALPVSLCVAELATSVPSNGGFLTWINVSMSPTMYFFSVILTLLLTFIDNAAFPVLFADYVCPLAPPSALGGVEAAVGSAVTNLSSAGGDAFLHCTPFTQGVVKVAMVLFSCGLNLLGIEAVGIASLLITLLSVSPFALMFVVHMVRSRGYINWRNVLGLAFPSSSAAGASSASSSSLPSVLPQSVNWSLLLPALTWNVAGLEQAGSVAEDVKDPQRNFIKAALITIALAWCSYIPPIIAASSRTSGPEDWGRWASGYWATVARDIGGSPLYALTVIGGVCSMFGLLMSAMCLTSRLMSGMGEAGAFPPAASEVLQTKGRRFGTPHWAIIINTICTGVCAVLLDFSSLVAIDQALYGIRILMIFLSAIKLRYAYPQLERPFKIPIDNPDVLMLALSAPIAFCMVVTTVSVSGSVATAVGFCALVGCIYCVSHLYVTYVKPFGFDGRILPVLAALPGAGLSADSPLVPHIGIHVGEGDRRGGGRGGLGGGGVAGGLGTSLGADFVAHYNDHGDHHLHPAHVITADGQRDASPATTVMSFGGETTAPASVLNTPALGLAGHSVAAPTPNLPPRLHRSRSGVSGGVRGASNFSPSEGAVGGYHQHLHEDGGGEGINMYGSTSTISVHVSPSPCASNAHMSPPPAIEHVGTGAGAPIVAPTRGAMAMANNYHDEVQRRGTLLAMGGGSGGSGGPPLRPSSTVTFGGPPQIPRRLHREVDVGGGVGPSVGGGSRDELLAVGSGGAGGGSIHSASPGTPSGFLSQMHASQTPLH